MTLDPAAVKLWCDIYRDVHHEMMMLNVDTGEFKKVEFSDLVAHAAAKSADSAIVQLSKRMSE